MATRQARTGERVASPTPPPPSTSTVDAPPPLVAVHETIRTTAIHFKIDLTAKSTHTQAMDAVGEVCNALHTQEQSAEYLRVCLGRVMACVNDNKLYEPTYASFEQFSRWVEDTHKLSRQTLQNAMLVARRLPTLDRASAESVPMTALTLVARAAKDATPAEIKQLLSEAADKPLMEFRQSLEDQGFIPVRTATPIDGDGKVAVTFRLSPLAAEQWKAMCAGRDQSEVFEQTIIAYAITHTEGVKRATPGTATRPAAARRKVA